MNDHPESDDQLTQHDPHERDDSPDERSEPEHDTAVSDEPNAGESPLG